MSKTPDFNALRAPFPYACIGWRVGAQNKAKDKGQALPYIDARDVQNRLDEAVGPENWQVAFLPSPAGGGVLCSISIRVGETWIAKQDAAQQDRERDSDRDKNQALELSVKAAMSDSFKRAAVMWGIGRYLYNFDPPWVALKEGKYLASYPLLPDHMLPESERGGAPLPGRTNSQASAAEDSTQAPAATVPAAKPMYDSSVAGDAVDPTAEKDPPKESFQSSVAGDVEDPTADPARSNPAAQPTEVPVMGTVDEWAGLSATDKDTIQVLNERIRNKVSLANIRSFLTEGKGKALPEWARKSLLTNLQTVTGALH
jgi:hypothetical protein